MKPAIDSIDVVARDFEPPLLRHALGTNLFRQGFYFRAPGPSIRVSGAGPGPKGLRIGPVSMAQIIGPGAREPRQVKACRGSFSESPRVAQVYPPIHPPFCRLDDIFRL